jgi:hypothetical protein
MDYDGLKNAICDDGETEVREAYVEPKDAVKLNGSLAGFAEARQTISPDDLSALLATAARDCVDAHLRDDKNYWFWRYRHLQVEWVANVVSAALYNEKKPTIIIPTVRGLMKAADILGVRKANEV